MRRLLICLLLLAAPASAQTTLGTVMPVPRIQFLDNTGVPLSGGSLTTYSAGTTTPLATCATNSTVSTTQCTTALPNPITLDSAGRPQTGGSVETAIYLLPQTYKFVLKNSSGVIIYTQDNVTATLGPNAVALQGVFTFSAPTVLTIGTGSVTPTQNVHGIDTSGGAANLNTIATTNVTQAFELFLYANNPASNPVTLTNAGNISLTSTTFSLNSATAWIQLMLKGSTWFEMNRSGQNLIGFTQISQPLTIATNVLTVDFAAGNYVTFPFTANITTTTFTHLPATGVLGCITFAYTADGTPRTWAWLTSTVNWTNAVAPTFTSTNTKIDRFTTCTSDGGSNWFGIIVGQNYAK